MGIPRGNREVLRKRILHLPNGLFILPLHLFLILSPRRTDPESYQKEHEEKAEKHNGMALISVFIKYPCREQTEQTAKEKEQCKMSVIRIRTLHHSFLLGSHCQIFAEFFSFPQQTIRLFYLGNGLFGFLRKLRKKLGLFFLFFPAKTFLRSFTHGGKMRKPFSDFRKRFIHPPFLSNETGLFLPAVILHHKVGKARKNALSGESALAHGNTLIHTLYSLYRNIVHPVDIKGI